ncbi:MAG: hypothetical protein IT361_11315 [Gemmatimonadaceae bacterium]|nr:hypothetical protein [Gemmatimonadaceae bacterium]
MAKRIPIAIWLWAWWHCRVEYSRNPILSWLGKRVTILKRYLQGARRVELADYDGTAGLLCVDGLDIQWGGACPVQGEGTLDGRECYYRSRGEGWQFHVAGASGDVFGDDAWTHCERRYIFPAGGWVSAAVSERCIRAAVAKFRAEGGAR